MRDFPKVCAIVRSQQNDVDDASKVIDADLKLLTCAPWFCELSPPFIPARPLTALGRADCGINASLESEREHV